MRGKMKKKHGFTAYTLDDQLRDVPLNAEATAAYAGVTHGGMPLTKHRNRFLFIPPYVTEAMTCYVLL